jgi:hypothetical protein
MKYQRTGFYKGIPGFTVSSDDLLLKAAEASIYRWWWEFLRLSPIYWYARTTGKTIAIPEMATAYESAGKLDIPAFGIWWKRHGKFIFEEIHRPADARIVDISAPDGHEFYQKSVLVEIPLTITKKKIISDIKKLLAQIDHEMSALTVISKSNATLRLKTKKFNLQTIENEYWVLIYRILYPSIPLWKLGDRLQLAPSNSVRGYDQAQLATHFSRGLGPFARLQSLTGRYLYKARFARYHVELGSFPNYTKVDTQNLVMPFGEKEHKNFLAATDETTTADSPWQQHIRQEYEKSLHYLIMRKNRLDRSFIRDSEAQKQFPEFVSGEVDLRH